MSNGMNTSLLITVIKVVSVLLVILIFNIIIYQYLTLEIAKGAGIEKFNQDDSAIDYANNSKYKPYNARLMYENTGEYPWNRHIINSSIPYDVNVKKEAVNVYYYEYDNYTYNEKLYMHTTLKCEACLYNRMAISILIVININYNLLIIINIYTNDCKCIN